VHFEDTSLELRKSFQRRLEMAVPFLLLLYFPLPAVDAGDRPLHLRACGQTFFHRTGGYPLRGTFIGKGRCHLHEVRHENSLLRGRYWQYMLSGSLQSRSTTLVFQSRAFRHRSGSSWSAIRS
jgi:hypothetical protein